MTKSQQSLLWVKRGLRVGFILGGALGTVMGIFCLPDLIGGAGILLTILLPCLIFGALCSFSVPWFRSRTLAGILPGALLTVTLTVLSNTPNILLLAIPTCLFGLLINALADPVRSTPEYHAALESDPSSSLNRYPKGLLAILALLFVFSAICRFIRPFVSGYNGIKSELATRPITK
jgi:hypothetical protein